MPPKDQDTKRVRVQLEWETKDAVTTGVEVHVEDQGGLEWHLEISLACYDSYKVMLKLKMFCNNPT